MSELIRQMEMRLTEIIDIYGYQEMADGFDQALTIVKKWYEKQAVEN